MSVPGNINPAAPPSSFDEDNEFYQESRWGKLKRKIIQEPLIPLGCALTVWALLEATKSIRSGDKHRTNRMFRRRIYAQGFTIFAMIIGSAYWESDRKKRTEHDELVEDKLKKEKHEAWLKELELREQEEVELRRIRSKIMGAKDQAKNDGFGSVSSVMEAGERREEGPILSAVRALWERR